MILKTLPLGPIEANCYVLTDGVSGCGAVIDPGDCSPRLTSAVADAGIRDLSYILLTHGHFDHIEGVAELLARFPSAQVAIGAADAPALCDPRLSLAARYARPFTAVPADLSLCEGQELTFGGVTLRVLETPGHSPGGVCFYDEADGILFSGDTLFCGSAGRTDYAGGNVVLLMRSLLRLAALPDGVTVCPGHGEATTIAREKRYNPYLQV